MIFYSVYQAFKYSFITYICSSTLDPLELRQYKNDPNQWKKIQFWNCRAFSSPTWCEKKRGNFKTRIIFVWLESFLYCLCSSSCFILNGSVPKTWPKLAKIPHCDVLAGRWNPSICTQLIHTHERIESQRSEIFEKLYVQSVQT